MSRSFRNLGACAVFLCLACATPGPAGSFSPPLSDEDAADVRAADAVILAQKGDAGLSDAPDGGGQMTPPRRISGENLSPSPLALEHGVHGMMVLKCRLEVDGTAQNCNVIKTLPYMTDALLAAARTWRYEPVKVDGKPVAVDYVFRIRLNAPP